jgi:hypothetical protein
MFGIEVAKLRNGEEKSETSHLQSQKEMEEKPC